MAAKKSAASKKIAKVMREYNAGTLRSGKPGPGKGERVTSFEQAIAIAMSEAGMAKKTAKKSAAPAMRKNRDSDTRRVTRGM